MRSAELGMRNEGASMSDEVPTTGNERRAKLLEAVKGAVCRDRQNTYGDAEDNFAVIADLWTTYKGVPFTPEDVAVLMLLVKVARLKSSPGHLDNWVDAAGYAVCGGGIVSKGDPLGIN